MAPAAGIWRPIRIEAYDQRLDNVHIQQEHQRDGSVLLHIQGEVKGQFKASAPVTGKIRCGLASQTSATTTFIIKNNHKFTANLLLISSARVMVAQWTWYAAFVSSRREPTLTSDDQTIDAISKTIGLRKLELIREADEFGESFRFRCNGLDFFAKGGNWIPCDIFPSRVSDGTYQQLLGAMADAHMNMVRVWGGGIYENDFFYETCDKLGILVWQDFMFACSTYPGFDGEWLDNVRGEVRDNVQRLRHHPNIALWCGNNEIEQGLVTDKGWNEHSMSWEDYKPIFDEAIPEIVAEEDPDRTYWPSSGHTPGEGRHDCHDERAGDVHSWSVWFGGAPFEQQRTWNFRFMSEFGFQSFPEPRTVASYTNPEDRNLTSWIMDYHQRSGSGNQKNL